MNKKILKINDIFPITDEYMEELMECIMDEEWNEDEFWFNQERKMMAGKKPLDWPETIPRKVINDG